MELNNTKTNQNSKTINKWKIAFIVLIGIIIGLVAFLLIRITAEREPNLSEALEEINRTEATFNVDLNKAQANAIVNKFLTDFQKDSKVKYQFILDKQALLIGNFVFFDEDVQFFLYFTPYVEDNGDVTLKATSVSIGKLKLPISELLEYADKNFDIPNWVKINEADNSVLLQLSQFETKGGMRISANDIDLIDDEIMFTVSLQ